MANIFKKAFPHDLYEKTKTLLDIQKEHGNIY